MKPSLQVFSRMWSFIGLILRFFIFLPISCLVIFSSDGGEGNVGEVVEVLAGGQRAMLLLEMIGGERTIEVDVFSLLLPSRPDLDPR